MHPQHRDYFWSLIDVAEVWGVGRQQSKKLKNLGIHTVLDLAQPIVIESENYFQLLCKEL